MTSECRSTIASSGIDRFSLTRAIAQWTSLLGAQNVLTDPESCSLYSRDCGLEQNTPSAILLPGSTDDLQKAVRIAFESRIQLHPISRGLNWGYGSAAPFSSGTVVIDLRRMNRIVEIDAELAYAVVEPGVTQQQLFDRLQETAPHLCMDVTGASPDSSLIGNLSERGYGQTPYGDRFQHSSGMEVVLADGTLLRTGFGHYPNSSSHHLYKWGIGPYLDGIFTQSNFGIITKVGIWLMPKPRYIGLLMIEMGSDTVMSEVAPILRELKLRGLLPSTVHISNDIRLLSCFDQFPYESESGAKPLPERAIASMREKWKVAPWTCFTSLRGGRRSVDAAIREIREAVSTKAKITFVTEDSVRNARRFGALYKLATGRTREQVEMLYNLVSGRPTHGPSLGAFWRHRSKPSSTRPDPLGDNCGLVWCAPVIPCTKQVIDEFIELVNASMRTNGFETNLTLTMLSERALCCTVAISFDKKSQQSRAEACYDSLLADCLARGFVPYRHGINVSAGKDHLFRDDDPFWILCKKMKATIDERNILSPGKYGIL